MVMRMDFTQGLSGLLTGVEHVFLNSELWPYKYFEENKNVEILLKKRDLSQALASLKNSQLIQNFEWSTGYRASIAEVQLKNDVKLGIEFWHKLSYDSLIFQDEMSLFKKKVRQANGLVIPSIEHHFEYVVLKNFLMEEGMTDTQYLYFNDFHVLVKEDLLEFFNLKYQTTFRSLYEMTEFSNSQLIAIKKSLKPLPINQFLRWAGFKKSNG